MSPTIYQLVQAIQLYGDNSSSVDATKWRSTTWLYDQLGSTAKALSYVGMAHFSWWKRRFILPILCTEAVSPLRLFREGDWTKADEPLLSEMFDFFLTISKQFPNLFDEALLTFLSQKKPSFLELRDEAFLASMAPIKGKELTWKGGETYKAYRRRISETVSRLDLSKRGEFRPRHDVESCIEPVREDSLTRWKVVLSQVPQMTKTISSLLKEIEGICIQARALKTEDGALYDRLIGMKKSVTEMLEALEMDYPSLELLSRQVSQSYFGVLIDQEELALATIRRNSVVIQKALLEERVLVSEKKEAFLQLCKRLSKALDSVPSLPSENVFKIHQAHVLKEARELLKDFRNTFCRGIDIRMTFENLNQKIVGFEEISKKLYEEGKRVDAYKEKVLLLEKRIEALPTQASSKRSLQKQALQNQLIEYRKTCDYSCQREIEFERIEGAVCALEK